MQVNHGKKAPLQRIRAQAQWQLQRVDLRALPPLQHEAAVQAFLAADAAAAFAAGKV